MSEIISRPAKSFYMSIPETIGVFPFIFLLNELSPRHTSKFPVAINSSSNRLCICLDSSYGVFAPLQLGYGTRVSHTALNEILV